MCKILLILGHLRQEIFQLLQFQQIGKYFAKTNSLYNTDEGIQPCTTVFLDSSITFESLHSNESSNSVQDISMVNISKSDPNLSDTVIKSTNYYQIDKESVNYSYSAQNHELKRNDHVGDFEYA